MAGVSPVPVTVMTGATSGAVQVAASVAEVQWDHEKPKNRLREQEEQLREYVAHHPYPYSPFYRRRFDAAGITPRNITGFDDLAKLEPTRWSDVTAEPVAFVLRPTERAIIRFGERKLVGAITRAKFRGKVSQVNRDLIDPAYKPIHWHFDGDVPIGYSSEDVERLCEAGRRVLHLAGLTRDDAIVDVTPPGPALEFWQLVDGARSAGLSAVHFGSGVAGLRTGVPGTLDDVACETCGRIGPRLSVSSASTARRPTATWAIPAAGLVPEPTAVGAPTPATAMFGRPPAAGEEEDEGEVQVLVPLDTDALSVLDEHPGVAAWQAEYRRVHGVDELIVFVAPAGVDRLGPLFRELDLTLSATQYVVQRPEQIAERRRRDGAIIDHR